MKTLRWWFATPLWKRVLAALVLGLLFALVWPQATPAVAFMGELFVRSIRMLVAPIVLVTIAAGITTLADPRRLGSLGARTIGLFAVTTAIAVSVGMAVATLIRPGVGAPLGTAAPHALGKPVTPYEQLIGIIPLNIFEALAKGDMLALIFVSILLGVGTVVARDAGKPFAKLLQSASAVLLRIVGIVMEATPFGVFALIANAIAANGSAVFVNVGWLALAVVVGSLFQIVVVHSLLLRLAARLPMLPFFRGIVDALAVAFSTASSSATLPVAYAIGIMAQEQMASPFCRNRDKSGKPAGLTQIFAFASSILTAAKPACPATVPAAPLRTCFFTTSGRMTSCGWPHATASSAITCANGLVRARLCSTQNWGNHGSTANLFRWPSSLQPNKSSTIRSQSPAKSCG